MFSGICCIVAAFMFPFSLCGVCVCACVCVCVRTRVHVCICNLVDVHSCECVHTFVVVVVVVVDSHERFCMNYCFKNEHNFMSALFSSLNLYVNNIWISIFVDSYPALCFFLSN